MNVIKSHYNIMINKAHEEANLINSVMSEIRRVTESYIFDFNKKSFYTDLIDCYKLKNHK